MQAVFNFLDDLWSIKWVKGYRTKIATWGLKIAAVVLSYQTLATSPTLLKAGFDLMDIPPDILLWVSPLPAYFAVKLDQFAKEHQKKDV